jgi:DNA-binding response OmpR family regulator
MKALQDIKVLIVEDDPFFQRVLLKRLASEGYKVIAANDGREGMKAIVSFEPDLVVSDWMMPEVDGLELCQSVKTGLGESAPYFILLTAKGEISSRLLGLETGADDYLVKPCDQGELMARVRAGLRIVLLTQELRATVAQLKQGGRSGPDPAAVTICPDCRQVLTPAGEWQPLESWLEQAQGRRFARAHCPNCRDIAAA